MSEDPFAIRTVDAPARGFAKSEFEARAARAGARMLASELDALVVTTAPNLRYFAGFATQFLESPTRPWFVILPRDGVPIAVIPEIGAPGFQLTWIEDIRTWPAPRPEDDGISLLASALGELPRRFGRIGWELGRESQLRMPITDFDRLRAQAGNLHFVDGAPDIWALRSVKSPAEIEKTAYVCALASDAFADLADKLAPGDLDYDVARRFRRDLIAKGADCVPFMAVCSGPGGPDQIIVGPSGKRLSAGDILFIDTGAQFDGYFCDFDRLYAFGDPGAAARRAHEDLWQATQAGFAAARPGATSADLWRTMGRILEQAGYPPSNVGRMGHGLGLQLTEPPSNMAGDETPLEAGMIMTLEPGVEYEPGKTLVHEENLVVTEDGARWLTRRAPRELPIISL